jgi:alpha-1,2-mannosyltransferase
MGGAAPRIFGNHVPGGVAFQPIFTSAGQFAVMNHRPGQRVQTTDEFYAWCAVSGIALLAALELSYLAIAQSFSFAAPSIDPFGYAVGRDFINSWMGGRSAFSGGPAPWFDVATYNAALREITGRADFPIHFWSYPPHLVLLLWPLGLLPYLPAYALWCVGGLMLYLFAAQSGGASRRHMLFLAVTPAVIVNVFFGQNGFLTAALLIGGLANLERRPIISGMLFGLLTIKPQFGLLVPVLLVLTGRWRVMLAAVATAAALGLMTALWFGADVWSAYVRLVVPQQHWILQQAGDFGWSTVASAFVNARLIGLSPDAAWVVQGVVSGCALAMVVWTFWRKRDPALSLALFVTATFLFSPWMLNYDLVAFGLVIVLLRERSDNTVADTALSLAVWSLPVAMLLFNPLHIPVALVVLPAFAGRLVWRLAHAGARRAAGREPSADVPAVPAAPLAAPLARQA